MKRLQTMGGGKLDSTGTIYWHVDFDCTYDGRSVSQ